MKKRLIAWGNNLTLIDLTLGKEYEILINNEQFLDDAGDTRECIIGTWEEVCIPVQGVQEKPIWSGFDLAKYGADKSVLVEENSGANGNYYRCTVLSKTTLDDRGSYDAEANDIIETLEMNFAEANAFKALWRKASARQGNGKADHNPLYDAQKVMWSGKRLVSQES